MEMNAGSKSNEMPFNPESDEVTIPQVKVIENGQVVDPNRIRPDVMQFIMMAKMTRDIGKIRRYFEDRTPKGLTENVHVRANDRKQRIDLTYKAKAIAFINDGPNVAAIFLDEPDKTPKLLGVNAVYEVDYEIPKLEYFWVQCNPGETALVHATALS